MNKTTDENIAGEQAANENEKLTSMTQDEAEEIKESSAQIEPPKKRGRPRGSKNTATTDNEKVNGVDAPTKPKRGRPPSKKRAPVDRVALSHQLTGLHQLGALVSGIPEVAISDQESAMLTDAVIAVSEQYDLSIDGKTGALIQLAAACAAIYVPRIIVVQRRKNQRGKLSVVKKMEPNETATDTAR